MEHVKAADMFLNDQLQLNLPPGGTFNSLMNSLVCLCTRVVDQLWRGAYERDPREVLEFVLRVVANMKRKPSGVPSLESVFRSLDRAALYLLARALGMAIESPAGAGGGPTDDFSVPSATSGCSSEDLQLAIDTLQKLFQYKNLMFSAANSHADLFACLTFLLIQLLSRANAILRRGATQHPAATRHMSLIPTAAGAQPEAADSPAQLLLIYCKRVWEEMYLNKKDVLEEVFRVTLNPVTPLSTTVSFPDLNELKSLLREPALKHWHNLLAESDADSESGSSLSKLHLERSGSIQQIQHRISRMGSEVFRFALRRPRRPDVEQSPRPLSSLSLGLNLNRPISSLANLLAWLPTHLALVRHADDFERSHAAHLRAHSERLARDSWRELERELIRECGLLGPLHSSPLDRWTLDPAECFARTRRRFLRNPDFFVHYAYRPQLELDSVGRHRSPLSLDSRLYYLLTRSARSSPVAEAVTKSDVNAEQQQQTLNSLSTLTAPFSEPSATDELLRRISHLKVPVLTPRPDGDEAQDFLDRDADPPLSSSDASASFGDSNSLNIANNQLSSPPSPPVQQQQLEFSGGHTNPFLPSFVPPSSDNSSPQHTSPPVTAPRRQSITESIGSIPSTLKSTAHSTSDLTTSHNCSESETASTLTNNDALMSPSTSQPTLNRLFSLGSTATTRSSTNPLCWVVEHGDTVL